MPNNSNLNNQSENDQKEENNDDTKSMTSNSNSDDILNDGDSGGKLKIDLKEDEQENKSDHEKSEHENSNSTTKKKSLQNDTNRDLETSLVESSQASNDSSNTNSQQNSRRQQQSSKKRQDRGLDGGYWSRMSIDTTEADSGRKRRRTTVDRFELSTYSNFPRLNMSVDESLLSLSDTKLEQNHHLNDDNSMHSESNTSQTNQKSSSSSLSKQRFVLFKSKSFLTVRNEDGTFFLCQATHSIYEDSKKCKIQWLEEIGKNKYKYGYVDWVDPFTIISKVNVKRDPNTNYYSIEEEDLKKVNDLLEKAIKDGGITVEFSSEDDDDDDDEEDKKDTEMKSDKVNIDLLNPEFYDKEEDTSSNESLDAKKSKKKKKINDDSDFKPESESDLDESKKLQKIQNNSSIKKEEKSTMIKKIVVDKANSSTSTSNISNQKSSIEIKKVIKSSPVNKNPTIKTPIDRLIVKKIKKIIDSDTETDDSSVHNKSINKKAKTNGEKTSTSNLKKSTNLNKTQNGNDTDELESEPVKKARTNETQSSKTESSTTVVNASTTPTTPNSKKRRLVKVISNRLLEENLKVQILTNDPFFEDTIQTPFISPLVQSKLAFRSIYLGDLKMLKSLIDDVDRVPSVHICRSVYNKWTPAQYALYLENKQALEILIDDFLNPKSNRVQIPETLFDKFNTGTYNPKSLGILNTRKLTESRGVREGNQAFNKDQNCLKYNNSSSNYYYYNSNQINKPTKGMIQQFFSDLFETAFEYGSSIDLYDFLITKWKSNDSSNNKTDTNFISYENRFIYENIYKAVLFGHRKLAAHVLETAPSGHGFNSVHIEVLKAENDSDLKCQLRSNQCTKKPFANDLITPIHCACINPNIKYLKTLLSITQDFNIADKKGRRPVHFAAVCEGPTPLEYLITRVSPYELDSDGNTPLHYACLSGRSVNVEILLNYADKKQQDDSAQTTELLIDNKYGLGGLNKPNRKGLLPIHLAISKNNYDCLKVLIKYGCNVEYPLPNSMGKITPLMYATQLGHYKIVKLLIENNAKVEARDRFHRNAVIHASMCGNITILSYLLRLGSNPNSQDSSGNSCLHYASAYGWYYGVKCLIEAGANVNVINDWKLTSFGAAFLKGHVGICDQLLSLSSSQIDVNFRTEDGETLVMLAVSSSNILNQTNVSQLDYIINKLNGNVKLRDSRGNNAFHYLAANKVDEAQIEKLYESNLDLIKEKCIEQEMFRIKMAELLHKAGCNPNLQNNELETPFFTSLSNLNFKFARYMLKNANFNIRITSKSTPSGQTILSLMANKCIHMDVCYVIFGPDYNDMDFYTKLKQEFEEMAHKRDENGLTPFQSACIRIRDYLKQQTIDQKVLENVSNFLFFLYKNCKSNPNELIYDKVVDDEMHDLEVDENADKKKKRLKFTPPLFHLISDRAIKLINDLNEIKSGNQVRIDLNLYDSDGLNMLLKSVILKESKFGINLLNMQSVNIMSQICKNESYLNESILQLCIRHSEVDLFDRILDLMLEKCKENMDDFARLIKYENLQKQNLLHILAESKSNEINSSSFLFNFKNKIELIFKNSLDYKHILIDMAKSVDKFNRTPIHLCLLTSGDRNSNLDIEMFFIDYLFNKVDLNLKHEIFSTQDIYLRLPLHYLFLNSKKFLTQSQQADRYQIGKPNEVSLIDPVELLTIILNQTPSNLIDHSDLYGYTPLHYASIRGSTISTTLLISSNASILTRSKSLNTPLSSAIYYKKESCVLQLLQSNKHKINLNDFYYLNPIESNQENDDEISLKCDLNEQVKDLYIKNKIDLYELILSHKWEGISWLVLANLDKYGLGRFDPIQSALKANEFGLVLRLVEKYERELSQNEFSDLLLSKSINDHERTLLHTLSLSDRANTNDLKRLIEKILPSNPQSPDRITDYLLQKDSFGSTFLHYSCFNLNFHLIDLIFNYLNENPKLPKPDVLLHIRDKYEQACYSLFFWQIGRVQYTNEFKDKIKSYTFKYLNQQQISNISKAFYPRINIPNFKSKDSIIGRKINDYPQVNFSQDSEQQLSPLLYAINTQCFDMCKFLLKDLKFDVNTTDSNQINTLVYAIRTNNLNLCNLILDHDYEPIKLKANEKIEVNTKAGSRMKSLFNNVLSKTVKQPNGTKQKMINSDDEENLSDDLSEDNNPVDDLGDDLLQNEYNLVESNFNQQQWNNNRLIIKSNINLTHLDSKLRTIFHHLACPIEYGSYINTEICKLLFSSFETPQLIDILKRVDSNVRTAMDYALKNGNIDLYDEFRRVLNRNDMLKLQKFELNDKFYDLNLITPNYKQDSELFLKNFDLKQTFKHDEDYFKVDPMSNMNKIGSLIWDEKTKIPYDCIMTKTDVSYGLYGMHSFYKMQLISYSYDQSSKFDEKQMCVLFTRWGRIGDTGQCQRTPFSNFINAKEEFCKVFKQKTGNDFVECVIEKKKPFENKARKYNLVKLESRVRPKLKDINFDLFEFKFKNQELLFQQSKFKSVPDYKEFWIDLLDVDYLKNKIHSNSTLSAEYLPLTQLSEENLKKANDLLNNKLKPLIDRRMEMEKFSKKEHVIEYLGLLDQINKYSNDFYELVPQMNYNYEKLKPISNERELDFQQTLLNQLSHAQISCRILMGAKYAMNKSLLNPFDYVYKSLNCKLELLDVSNIETQYILRYINPSGVKNNTNSNRFKIKRIFKFMRSDEEERFENFNLPSGANKLKNRFLLWHGTSTENLISIMSKGLVKAPHDAKSNGQRYGKGIYFSDSFEFSSNYSSGKRVKKQDKYYSRNYILLCEVALGRVKELRTSYEVLDTLPAGYDSVKALGRLEPDPNNQVTLPNGCIIPLGEMVESQFKPGEYIYSRSCNENQYVVYNEAQVCLRYILQYYVEN